MNEGLPDRSNSQHQTSGSFFSDLPSYSVKGDHTAGRPELVCGECEQPNPGTASYSVLHIIFLLFFIVWRIDPVFKCPRCMRAYLLQRLPLSLLLATIFAPFILVWWGILFLRTLGR
jgi:hypothetical protein